MTPPPATGTAAAARTGHATRPARPAPRPRRESGPVRRPAAVPRPARRRAPLPERALARLRELPDGRLVDRLLGGRVWIVLTGTLLVGIVTLQLTLLKLNAGIGHSIERTAVLEQANATLRAEISRLSDSGRIVAAATRLGFVTPLQGSPVFVSAAPRDAWRALSVMRVPQQSPAAPPPSVAPPSTTSVVAPATPAATTSDPTAVAGTMTAVPPTTSDQTSTTATAPTTTQATTPPAASTPAATATTPAAGGAAAPQG